MNKEITQPKPKAYNLKSFAREKFGVEIQVFRNWFSDDEWSQLKALNVKSKTLIPKQIEFIFSITGKPQ